MNEPRLSIELGADLREPVEHEFGRIKFQVRPLTNRRVRELREGLGLPYYPPKEESLSGKDSVALADACLIDCLAAWDETAVGCNGEPAACTPENIKLFARQAEAIAEQIVESAKLLPFRLSLVEEREAGNSQSSSPTGEEQPTSSEDADTPSDAKSAQSTDD